MAHQPRLSIHHRKNLKAYMFIVHLHAIYRHCLRARVAQSIVTEWMTGVQSLAGAKGFCSSLCVQTGSGAHPASYPVGVSKIINRFHWASKSLLS
jgi:hypothetical protein